MWEFLLSVLRQTVRISGVALSKLWKDSSMGAFPILDTRELLKYASYYVRRMGKCGMRFTMLQVALLACPEKQWNWIKIVY